MARLLATPLAPVLPVRLCALGGPLYRVLLGYKESPVDLARRRFAGIVGAHFEAFLDRHAACVRSVAGGAVDLVLPVPSSSRPGGAPLGRVPGLRDVVERAFGPPALWMPSLLRRSRAHVGHMRPHIEAFAPVDPPRVRDARVVLLDDTYVSGARAQSAAAALRRYGARAVVIVPLGRVLRPDRSGAHAAYLRRVQRAAPPDRCGRCARCREEPERRVDVT